MGNDTNTIEKAYTTKEISIMLDMAIPTVRKYSQYLERSQYVFIKSETNARLFVESDIMVLRYIKELRDKTNINLDKAINIVIEKFGKGAIQDISPSNTTDIMQYEEQYEDPQIAEMAHLKELIQGLCSRLDEQERFIKARLDKHDEMLVQSLKESMEVRKQIAAASQEKEEKRSLFSRIFNRK